MEFTTLGALVGLIIAIILIIKKVHPAYSLILGALIGGIVGGGGLTGTVGTMVSGAQSMSHPYFASYFRYFGRCSHQDRCCGKNRGCDCQETGAAFCSGICRCRYHDHLCRRCLR